MLTDHLMQQQGVAPDRIAAYFGAAEDSHVAVAAAVASGAADAGVGVEAAARAFALEFIPLMEARSRWLSNKLIYSSALLMICACSR